MSAEILPGGAETEKDKLQMLVEIPPETASKKVELQSSCDKKRNQFSDSLNQSIELKMRILNIVSFRNVLWAIVWLSLSVILFAFSWSLVDEYLSNYPGMFKKLQDTSIKSI